MRMRKKSASVIVLFAMLMAVMIPQAGAFAGSDGEPDDEETSDAEGDGEDSETDDSETDADDSDSADDGTEDEDVVDDNSMQESDDSDDDGDDLSIGTMSVESESIEIQSGPGSSNHCSPGLTQVRFGSGDVSSGQANKSGISVTRVSPQKWTWSYGGSDEIAEIWLFGGPGDAIAQSLTSGELLGKPHHQQGLPKRHDISHVDFCLDPAPPPVCLANPAGAQGLEGLDGTDFHANNKSLIDGGRSTATLRLDEKYCDPVTVHLTSYGLTGGTALPWDSQFLYDNETVVIEPGQTETLEVDLPPCGYQVDLYIADDVVDPPPHHGPTRPGVHLLDWDLETGTPCYELDLEAQCAYLKGNFAIVEVSNPTGFDILVTGHSNLIDADDTFTVPANGSVLLKAAVNKKVVLEFGATQQTENSPVKPLKVDLWTKKLDLCGADITPVKEWQGDGEGDAGVTVKYGRKSAGVGESVFVPYGHHYKVTEDAEVNFRNVSGLGWFKSQPTSTELADLIQVPTVEHVVTNKMKPEADIEIRSLCLLKESLRSTTTIFEVVNNGSKSVTIDIDGERVRLRGGKSHLFTSDAKTVTVSWGGEGTKYQEGSATAKGSKKLCGEWVTPEKQWSDEGDHGDAGVTVTYLLWKAGSDGKVFVPYNHFYLVTEDLPVWFTNDSGLGLFKLSPDGKSLEELSDADRTHTHVVVNTPKPEIELELDALCVYLPGDEDGFGIVQVTNPNDHAALFTFTEGGPASGNGPYLLTANQTRTFAVDSEGAVAIAWGGLLSKYAPGSADADLTDALCGAEVTPVKGWDSEDEIDIDVNLSLTHGETTVGVGESVFVPFGGTYTVDEDAGPWVDLFGLGEFTLTIDDLGITAEDLEGIAADDLSYEHLVVNEQLFPAISLTKEADETAFELTSEDDTFEVTYTYTITNTGDLPLSGLTLIDDIAHLEDDVDLTDDLTAALLDQLGSTTLDVDESVVVTWSTEYGTDDPTTIDNIATVTGFDPWETEVSDSDDESITSTTVFAEVEEPDTTPEPDEVEEVSVEKKIETEVLAETLPRTGASILALLMSGLLALFVGTSALRRRRNSTD